MHRIPLALIGFLLAAPLSACAGNSGLLGELLARPEAATRGKVDVAAAVRLISDYRASRGLKPLVLDDRLMKIAADHAERMASMDRMSHVLPGEGSFAQRVAAGGFEASMAAENVAAGQDSLAAVFETWRKSPGHNANLLLDTVSRMGIALAIQPAGRYHTYWALVLGEPYVPPAGGPPVGPAVMFGGAPQR